MRYKISQAVLAWLSNISIVKRLWLAVSILAAIPKMETFEINYYTMF
ncbi:MAG: hypothetical protein UU09_C0005G0005 [Microgenomates group bacterium GW2011_GWA2_40_6]|nr:MAG: hypothetical protein UU09_C0005G0005 [Microgenomates group bacterium GW2011_GWA2_40_6]